MQLSTPRITDVGRGWLPISLIAGSKFLITNISSNLKPKSERLERLCYGPISNQYKKLNKIKIRFVTMSLPSCYSTAGPVILTGYFNDGWNHRTPLLTYFVDPIPVFIRFPIVCCWREVGRIAIHNFLHKRIAFRDLCLSKKKEEGNCCKPLFSMEEK